MGGAWKAGLCFFSLILLSFCMYWLAKRRSLRRRRGKGSMATAEMYGVEDIRDFGLVVSLGDWVEEQMIRTEILETVLDLCREVPERGDLLKDTFYEVLRSARYLSIQKEGRNRLFYKNLARKGLMGAHAQDIVRGCGDCDCGPHITENTYVRLLDGFVRANDKKMKILDATAIIFGGLVSEREVHGNVGAVTHTSWVRKIRVMTSKSSRFFQDLKTLVTLGWFVRRLKVAALDVSCCDVTAGHVAEIAKMRLAELSMSKCRLQKGSLVQLAESCAIRGALVVLDISQNRLLGCEDRSAVGTLRLRELGMRKCQLPKKGLVLMLRGTVLGRSLSKLDVSKNKLSEEDAREIAKLRLERLDLHKCYLTGENLVLMLRCSPLGRSLRRLDVSKNKLAKRDIDIISGLSLEQLNMHFCSIPGGYLAALGERSSVLKGTLRCLDTSFAKISLDDMKSLSRMVQLESLRMHCCRIAFGGIPALLAEKSSPKKTLNRLFVSSNDLARDDMAALSRAEQLEELSIHNCRIPAGSLGLLVDEGAILPSTLRKLVVSGNKLELEDMEPLSRMARLDSLNIYGCRAPLGSLRVLLGGASALKDTLQRLDVSKNDLGLEDVADISAMTRLEELDMSFCSLPAGSAACLTRSPGCKLVDTLRWLNISFNRLSADDIQALSEMSLERLDVSTCGLGSGDLALLGENVALAKTLQRLRALNNSLGVRDKEALARIADLQFLV